MTVSAAQERYLDDALTSVRHQTYRSSDVLVVRWGPGRDVPDLATARNQGLASVRTPYARLLEASDTLPWHSTAVLVRAIGADPAATAAGRSARGDQWRDRAFAPAPGLDPGLADRLLDVRRWQADGLAFDPAHDRFGDATVLAADEVLGVARIDAVTHEDRDRALGLPFGHLRRWSAEVDAWLAAVGSVVAPPPGWVDAVVDHRLPAVLTDVESMSESQWEGLVALAGRLWSAGPRARVEARVLCWLTATDDRDRVTRLVLARWRGPADVPTEVRDGRVRADLGIGDLPDDVALLDEAETPLVLDLQSASKGSVEVVGFVRGVATTEPPRVTASAEGRALNVGTTATPTATRVAGEAEHDHAHAWLTIERPPRGRATVTVESQGVRRQGELVVPRGDRPRAPHTDPRGDDEIGPYAQRRLQRRYAGEHRIEPDLAYFQCYTGQAAADSPLAIHHQLRRLRPDVRVRWLVESPDVAVPEGAQPVLFRSEEWYDTLARARWLVTNIEMELWFRRKEGQELVQTFHGNPGKTMGLGAWRLAGLTPGRIEQMLDHGSRNWTLLVSPSPEMTRHYREQFAYDGPVEEHGMPRDDVLVGPDAPGIRARVRDELGIGDRVAVLYLPTWRDQDALDYRRARLGVGLDVGRVARALGPGHVVLFRGHRFHRDVTASGPGVLDVSDRPDVNDLLLAADVAVLDYSSARFDFALTGRPMIFHVPDLDDYTGGRGFLYDFRESAPGPLLATEDEVVAALGDLPAVEREYAGARAVFHERFNAGQDGHAAERVARRIWG